MFGRRPSPPPGTPHSPALACLQTSPAAEHPPGVPPTCCVKGAGGRGMPVAADEPPPLRPPVWGCTPSLPNRCQGCGRRTARPGAARATGWVGAAAVLPVPPLCSGRHHLPASLPAGRIQSRGPALAPTPRKRMGDTRRVLPHRPATATMSSAATAPDPTRRLPPLPPHRYPVPPALLGNLAAAQCWRGATLDSPTGWGGLKGRGPPATAANAPRAQATTSGASAARSCFS